MVITIRGPVRPEELGVTLTHEHVLVDLTGYYKPPDDLVTSAELAGPVRPDQRGILEYYDYWSRDNLILNDIGTAIAELRYFTARGGRSICDVSSRGIRLDGQLSELRTLSEALDLNVIVGTGCYIESHQEPLVATMPAEDLAELFIREIVEGIDDSGVRAGILGEIGLSTPPSAAELRFLEAAAVAHRATGAAIVVHQSDYRDFQVPHLALDLLEALGVSSDRVVIAHACFCADVERIAAVAERGAYVAFDHFGMPGYERDIDWQLPRDLDYVRRVIALVEAGHVLRLLLSHDICVKTHLRAFGGHGYSHLLGVVRDMFSRSGLAPQDFDTMMLTNPACLLPLHTSPSAAAAHGLP